MKGPDTSSNRRFSTHVLKPILVVGVLALLHSASLASAQGVTDNYIVPTAESRPHGIVAGPDGNLWCAELRRLTNHSFSVRQFDCQCTTGGRRHRTG